MKLVFEGESLREIVLQIRFTLDNLHELELDEKGRNVNSLLSSEFCDAVENIFSSDEKELAQLQKETDEDEARAAAQKNVKPKEQEEFKIEAEPEPEKPKAAKKTARRSAKTQKQEKSEPVETKVDDAKEQRAEDFEYERDLRPLLARICSDIPKGKDLVIAMLRPLGYTSGKQVKPEHLGKAIEDANKIIEKHLPDDLEDETQEDDVL